MVEGGERVRRFAQIAIERIEAEDDIVSACSQKGACVRLPVFGWLASKWGT